jgi:hypothetical protein
MPFKLGYKQNSYDKIILIQQYFIPIDDDRLMEINKCLEWNINNPLIDEIHLLNETFFDIPILKHNKIKQINIGCRLTYKLAFEYGNTFGPRTIKLLSNLDISFDESLDRLKYFDLSNVVLALTRYNITSYTPFLCELYNSDGVMYKNIGSGAQDTWIFTTIKVNKFMNFQLGIAGCDHYILYLLQMLRIKLLNNCSVIKTYHHHLSYKRYYDINNKIGDFRYYRYIAIC